VRGHAQNLIGALVSAALAGCSGLSSNVPAVVPLNASSAVTQASPDTYVKIPTSDSIQTDLINTFPTGTFVAKNSLKTKFHIPDKPQTCGYNKDGPCNFYDAFTGSGNAITITVSITGVARVYTLMNAYSPPVGQKIATVEFFGSKGTNETFDLVAGDDIRDFYQGNFANTLNNGVKGVVAKNAFTCEDPKNCLGGAGTGDVNTGEQGTYNLDEQEYDLNSKFKSQSLVKIVITDTDSGATPILLGITAQPG
jgi:hypothetical protein